MDEPTGVWEGFSMVDIAMLRAQYITDVTDPGMSQWPAAKRFDEAYAKGKHPEGESHEDLVDELVWMKKEAEDNSTDLGDENRGNEGMDPHADN